MAYQKSAKRPTKNPKRSTIVTMIAIHSSHGAGLHTPESRCTVLVKKILPNFRISV